MSTDLAFEANLKALVSTVTSRAKTKDATWAKTLAKPLESATKTFNAASLKARTAEAAWKKKIGAKQKIVDSAAAAWHAYANHLRADLTTDDLTTAVMPFESAGGLESSLDRLIEAFSKNGVAADVPYAKHALAELLPARHTLDALLLETTKEYTAWRNAAAKKNAARATAWELCKCGQRNLRAATNKRDAQTQQMKTKKATTTSKTTSKSTSKTTTKKRPTSRTATHANA